MDKMEYLDFESWCVINWDEIENIENSDFEN